MNTQQLDEMLPKLRTNIQIWDDLRENRTKPWPNLGRVERIMIVERDAVIEKLKEIIERLEKKSAIQPKNHAALVRKE